MGSVHSLPMPCTCVNNTPCNQPKIVLEPEIPALRGKEWQYGVGDTQAAWQYGIVTFMNEHQGGNLIYILSHSEINSHLPVELFPIVHTKDTPE